MTTKKKLKQNKQIIKKVRNYKKEKKISKLKTSPKQLDKQFYTINLSLKEIITI